LENQAPTPYLKLGLLIIGIPMSSDPLWEMMMPENVEGLARSIPGAAETMTFWRHEWRIKSASGVVK